MKPKILPLPEDVASRIAAGEVIERPASVLKELIENSLDAGARRVAVEIEGAGRELIRVADDGEGLGPEDCRMAFARHATSKIRALADIDALATFGFRGEALFSIAAVSEAALSSGPRGARAGWRVEFKGGRPAGERAAPAPGGTVVEVRRLFFNTPARAKFLKSDAAERAQLARVVEEAALANPAVGFVYKSEGRAIREFAPQKDAAPDSLARRAAEALGDSGRGLLFAQGERGGLSVRALVSPADALVPSRGLQYCFVNRRPVSSRTVQQALYRAYEPFRAKNRHPAAVLFLEVPPDRLDVNVHPTKREVRFRDEGAVFELVTKALAKTLLESKGIPTLAPARLTPAPERAGGVAACGEGSPELLALEGGTGAYAPPRPTHSYATEPAAPVAARRPIGEERVWFKEGARFLGQIERAYLVFESDGGLLVVDQHAAQERILFERYYNEARKGRPQVQRLMLPVAVELPASGVERVLAQKKRLARAGFELEPRGRTAVQVLAVPAVFSAKAEAVRELVGSLLDGLLSPKAAAADIRYDATATIACKAAVKAHDPLGEAEALALLRDLRACEDSTCCPHGRPALLSLNREELARRFKRPGAPPLG